MYTRKTLGLSLAILLTTSTLYSCSSTAQPSATSRAAAPETLKALSNLPEQSQVMALLQRLQNIGWVNLNSTGLRIIAATVVLRNNVQTSLTNLSMTHMDDFTKFAVMTENANIEDVIQIIDLMLSIHTDTILNMVSETPNNPQKFENMVYYATCQHDLIKRGRGCELALENENPYNTEYNPSPSPTAICTPSPSDCQQYKDYFGGSDGIMADRMNGNELATAIYIGPGTPNGRTMFNQMWRFMGLATDVLQGNWYGGSNLNSFNGNCAAGMNDADSAWGTFTGKIALEHGFTRVEVVLKDPPNAPCPNTGPYNKVEVKYYK